MAGPAADSDRRIGQRRPAHDTAQRPQVDLLVGSIEPTGRRGREDQFLTVPLSVVNCHQVQLMTLSGEVVGHDDG